MGNIPWPGWLWRKYVVVASPSQLAAYEKCPTQWWLRKVLRLPERDDEKQFVFGNVLHDVAARWHRGEQEIYPRGWAFKLSDFEAQQIRDMVTTAIHNGTFDRNRPIVGVEKALHTELIPGRVALIGKLDVMTEEGVEDHKTVGDRKYKPTEAKIRRDPQMLCYARMWQRETGRGEREDVKLTLNCLSKDTRDPYADRVSATVTAAEVDDWWENTAKPLAERMLEDSAKKDVGALAKDESGRACRQYRGCPFIDVCTGMESVPDYRARFNKR